MGMRDMVKKMALDAAYSQMLAKFKSMSPSELANVNPSQQIEAALSADFLLIIISEATKKQLLAVGITAQDLIDVANKAKKDASH